MTHSEDPQRGTATLKTGRHGWPARPSFLECRGPVLILCAWLLLYAARPFSLGFYSDDWSNILRELQVTGAFSLSRLSHIAGAGQPYIARPVAGLILFAISSIAGRSPFAYQAVCALLALGAALSLRGWLRSLLPRTGAHSLAADLAAVVWLSAPWSAVITGWPVCAMAALPAQILFTEAARLMSTSEPGRIRRTLLVAALLLASHLTYEAFYFQGILVAAFYYFRNLRRSVPRRYGLLLAACAAQVASIVLNRSVAHSSPQLSKALAPQWRMLSEMSLRLLPGELLRGAGPLGRVWAAFFALILLAAACSALTLLLRSDRRCLSGSLGVIALGLGAMPILAVTYALAGYRIAFSGFTSRTLAGASCAFAVVVYGLLCVSLSAGRRAIAGTAVVAALLFALTGGMAQHLRVLELAAVWREEKAVLEHVPIQQILALPRDRAIRVLYIGPSYYGEMPIFGAFWELTGAVFSLPELRDFEGLDRRAIHIHPATALYNWSWDGAELTQEYPGYWRLEFPGKALYVWDYDECRLFPVEKGFRWNPAATLGEPVTAAATFLGIDSHTQGNWAGSYGIDGFSIAAEPSRNPGYAKVDFAGTHAVVWGTPAWDGRALENFSGAAAVAWWTPLMRWPLNRGRVASGWSSPSGFDIDANLHDGVTHKVAVYCVDWDSGGVRTETIELSDSATGAVLDTRTISNFANGQYLVWNLRGHVRLRVTRTTGSSAVVSGLFFR